MKKIINIFTAILLTITLTACSESNTSGIITSDEVSVGQINDMTYTNEYFGLTIDVNEDYNLYGSDVLSELVGAQAAETSELLGMDEDELNKYLEEYSLYLTMISQNPLEVIGLNANIIVGAES